jgi:dihydroneopterin aldolase
MTGRISLEGLEFHAFHGVYPHERESGNWFEVDITVEVDLVEGSLDDNIQNTVNYETLYRFVKEEMEKPSRLLETVVENIAGRVIEQLPAVRQVDLKVAKLHPPIGGKCKKASVSVSKRR